VIAFRSWTLPELLVYRSRYDRAERSDSCAREARRHRAPPDGGPELAGKIVVASRSRFMKENAVEFWRIARVRDAAESPEKPAIGRAERAWSLRHNLASIFTTGIMLPFFIVGVGVLAATRSAHGAHARRGGGGYFLMRGTWAGA